MILLRTCCFRRSRVTECARSFSRFRVLFSKDPPRAAISTGHRPRIESGASRSRLQFSLCDPVRTGSGARYSSSVCGLPRVRANSDFNGSGVQRPQLSTLILPVRGASPPGFAQTAGVVPVRPLQSRPPFEHDLARCQPVLHLMRGTAREKQSAGLHSPCICQRGADVDSLLPRYRPHHFRTVAWRLCLRRS